jgi:hypothetical protein
MVRKSFAVVALGLASGALAGCGGSSGSSGSASGSGPVTVQLAAQNGSGESGTATLTADGERTKVAIDLSSGSMTPQPAHIHQGTCAELDAKPQYPLANVVDGKSESTVDASLAKLEGSAFAINVHESAQHIDTYVSCGDIGGSGGGSSGGAGGY